MDTWMNLAETKEKIHQLIHWVVSHNEGLLLKTSKFRESWLHNINYLTHKP